MASVKGGSPDHTGLARRLRQSRSRAFTLVELMIVVSILGVLMAAVIPAYQQARSAALIGALIGELTGFAKQCAVINAAGTGETPVPPALSLERGGVQIIEGCAGENQGARLQASWGAARAGGIPCLNSSSLSTSSKATVTITPQSTLSCSFED